MKISPWFGISGVLAASIGVGTASLIVTTQSKQETVEVNKTFDDEINKIIEGKNINNSEINDIKASSAQIQNTVDSLSNDIKKMDFSNWYHNLQNYFWTTETKSFKKDSYYPHLLTPQYKYIVVKDFIENPNDYTKPTYKPYISNQQPWKQSGDVPGASEYDYRVIFNGEDFDKYWKDLAKNALGNDSEEAINFLQGKVFLNFDFVFSFGKVVQRLADPNLDNSDPLYITNAYLQKERVFINNDNIFLDKSNELPYPQMFSDSNFFIREWRANSYYKHDTYSPYNSLNNKNNDKYYYGHNLGMKFMVQKPFDSANSNSQNFSFTFFNDLDYAEASSSNWIGPLGYRSSATPLLEGNYQQFFKFCSLYCKFPFYYNNLPLSRNVYNTDQNFQNHYISKNINHFDISLFLDQKSSSDRTNIYLSPFIFKIKYGNQTSDNYRYTHDNFFLRMPEFYFAWIPKTKKLIALWKRPVQNDWSNRLLLSPSNGLMGEIPIGIFDYRVSFNMNHKINFNDKF